jgi:hypothetical protein
LWVVLIALAVICLLLSWSVTFTDLSRWLARSSPVAGSTLCGGTGAQSGVIPLVLAAVGVLLAMLTWSTADSSATRAVGIGVTVVSAVWMVALSAVLTLDALGAVCVAA